MKIDLDHMDHTELAERVALGVVDRRAESIGFSNPDATPITWSEMSPSAKAHVRIAMWPVISETIKSLEAMQTNIDSWSKNLPND